MPDFSYLFSDTVFKHNFSPGANDPEILFSA